MARTLSKTLDNTRKVGILDQELRVLDLHKKLSLEKIEKLGDTFNFMKKDATNVMKTISFWVADNDEAISIFKEMDMDNSKKLSISEIHRYIMTK